MVRYAAFYYCVDGAVELPLRAQNCEMDHSIASWYIKKCGNMHGCFLIDFLIEWPSSVDTLGIQLFVEGESMSSCFE